MGFWVFVLAAHIPKKSLDTHLHNLFSPHLLLAPKQNIGHGSPELSVNLPSLPPGILTEARRIHKGCDLRAMVISGGIGKTRNITLVALKLPIVGDSGVMSTTAIRSMEA